MILEAMATCQADGISMCDAHPDLEVFRLRLGKALNFEFNEDSQTGLFQRRDPREGFLYHHSTQHALTMDRRPAAGHRKRSVHVPVYAMLFIDQAPQLLASLKK